MKATSRTRRWRLLTAALALTLGAAVGARGSTAASDPTVTVNLLAYSGAFQDNFVTAYIKPFEAHYPNIKIHFDQRSYSSAQTLAILTAGRGHPSINVTVQDTAVSATEYKEGLTQPLDPMIVTNLDNLYPQARYPNNDGAAFSYDAFVIVYNKSKISSPPTSWKVLLDPKYKGQVGAWAPPDLEGIFLIAVLDKALGKNYLNGDQPALQALKAHSQNIQTWAPNPDTYPLIIAGSMELGVGYNARAQFYVNQSGGKLGVAFPSEGIPLQVNRINLVKGAPHQKEAQQFINYCLSANAQATFAKLMYYSPTNAKATLPAAVLERTAFGPTVKNHLMFLDYGFIAKVRDAWGNDFTHQVLNQ
jgi:putative spermidine/putrescine transport system substrate-binding protein